MSRPLKGRPSRVMGFHVSSEGRVDCICFRTADGLFDQPFSTKPFYNASWTTAARSRLSPSRKKSSAPVSALPVKQRTDEWSLTPERIQTEAHLNAPRALRLHPAIRAWSFHFLQFLGICRQKRRWRYSEAQIKTDSPGKAVLRGAVIVRESIQLSI